MKVMVRATTAVTADKEFHGSNNMRKIHKPMDVELFKKICEDNGIKFLPDDGLDLESLTLKCEDGKTYKVAKGFNIFDKVVGDIESLGDRELIFEEEQR